MAQCRSEDGKTIENERVRFLTDEYRQKFKEIFQKLVQDMLDSPEMEDIPQAYKERAGNVLNYNIPCGKLVRYVIFPVMLSSA